MSPSQTIGPFYHFALTTNAALGCLVSPATKGERISLHLRIFDGDGLGVPDGMIELWQADSSGIYNHPDDPRYELRDPHFAGFGRLATSIAGECIFETIRPGPVGSEAAHINVTIFARGLLGHLTTRIYFADDLAVFAMIPIERRSTILAKADPETASQWNLDIHLQGEKETVFFNFETPCA